MKILLFSGNGVVVEGAGGAERVLCNMANELTVRGHQVTVLCDDLKQGLPFYPLMKEVDFININESRHNDKLYPHSLFPDTVKRHKDKVVEDPLRSILLNVKPDIIISFFLRDHNRIAKLIGHDRPLIVMHHMDPNHGLLEAPFDRLCSLQHCDCLQVLLPGFAKTIQEVLPWVKLRVIPNAVALIDDINLANPSKHKNEYVIATLGRLERGKQPHLLIRSFSRLAKEYSQWKVRLYGHGYDVEYKKYLEALIHELGLDNQVFLMGTTDKPLDILRESDIFAFPSAHEGFGLALAEAMGVGLPCVGLKTAPGVNELIVDGYNGLLSDNNELDFAQKMKRLMDNPQLRTTMGRNGHEFVKQFEPKKIWDQWENLIIETFQQYQPVKPWYYTSFCAHLWIQLRVFIALQRYQQRTAASFRTYLWSQLKIIISLPERFVRRNIVKPLKKVISFPERIVRRVVIKPLKNIIGLLTGKPHKKLQNEIWYLHSQIHKLQEQLAEQNKSIAQLQDQQMSAKPTETVEQRRVA